MSDKGWIQAGFACCACALLIVFGAWGFSVGGWEFAAAIAGGIFIPGLLYALVGVARLYRREDAS